MCISKVDNRFIGTDRDSNQDSLICISVYFSCYNYVGSAQTEYNTH